MTIVIPVVNFGKEGGYRVLSKLASHFIDKNHRVIFLAPQSAPQPYYATKAIIYWYNKGGQMVMQKPDMLKRMSTLQVLLGLYKAIRRLAIAEKINVILANLYLTVFPMWLARPKGTILFYYIQAYEPEFFDKKKGLRNWLGYRLSKWSYQLPLHKIVNANHYRSYKELKTNWVVFPGLNLQTYRPAGRRSFMENGVLRIGTIGRIETWKGTAEITAAYRQLLALRLPVELYLAFGSETMVENLPGVMIVQPHGDENLASFYQHIDVYVSAVLVDGPAIHYPVVEAMACGTPVITTNLYPASASNATIIDSQQRVGGIVAGIRRLLQPGNSDERQQRVINALKAVEGFDWNISGDKMLACFETVKMKQ